ncbi:hypothetical protein Amet_4594 [Alkaliphilus metalliredigens QYMF]|uniref:DUF3231 family protein n=1 Tax=Alkaliphilus metalliredigens (strain QYMF) TaxID=293826 RepID=A6TWU7_ALKMQ|nr:DUF3231 family protein [Alkaliphilus metalliredigens]ABR50665.1 hypothetical protein Amet_4594 [Alkaliphilus metalliredigens QYMF]
MYIGTETKLTASEIAGLWTSYVNDSMGACVLRHFLNNVEDRETKAILKYALSLSEKHMKKIAEHFNEEKLPIPQGFTDSDVNMNAPRLYTDSFYLFYLRNMGRVGLVAYSMGLGTVGRSDIRDYFTGCLGSSIELLNKVTSLKQSKGIFIRAPRVAVPKQVTFVEKEDFMDDILGKKRPLLTVEVTHLYENIMTNIVGGPLVTGFGQTTNSKEVKDFMFRGMDIASKHKQLLSLLLSDENIPTPSIWDTFVTDSTVAPFSDKLMLFHVTTLNGAGIGNYSAAMVASLRKDLHVNYGRLATEIGQYVDDGTKIMIHHGWLEQPPQAIKHRELSNV